MKIRGLQNQTRYMYTVAVLFTWPSMMVWDDNLSNRAKTVPNQVRSYKNWIYIEKWSSNSPLALIDCKLNTCLIDFKILTTLNIVFRLFVL